jgi:hypothetical protein
MASRLTSISRRNGSVGEINDHLSMRNVNDWLTV